MSYGLKSVAALAGSLATLLFTIGCNQNPEAPPMASVSGIVTFDGEPLTHGTVQFIPDRDRGTTGRMALGEIQADGRFTMTTRDPEDGAQIGFHKVAIQCYEKTESDNLESGGAAPRPPRSLIPEKFGDPETSGLTIEVKPEGNDNVLFELKSSS